MKRARLAPLAAALLLARPEAAPATVRYGDVQISGNVQTQNLLRVPDWGTWSLVQQRNTFRLQYEHQLVSRRSLLGGLAAVPWVRSASLFVYYRLAYDSIYDIAPGGFLRTQDGSRGGKIGDLRRSARRDVAFENVLREVFVDIETTWPVSFRTGRQQVVWGEAINIRGLDSVNALDLTWHFQQEGGLAGKAGFSELRIPAWMIKMLVNLGTVGPFSNAFLEVLDIPFDFNQTKVRFLPAPWSVPVRNPFRGGLVIDAGAFLGGPPEILLVQPCFDLTGDTRPNAAARPDFSEASETGFCHARGLQRSQIPQGLYDRRDPRDVNQVGVRFGAVAPFGANFTLNYMHRRLIVDAGGAAAKVQIGAVFADPVGFAEVAPHETFDPITRETTAVAGYVRLPLEFYYPYVHVAGVSANYPESFTGSALTAEAAWTHGVPFATLDPTGNGIRRTDQVVWVLAVDRPTWIRALNRRSTWLVVAQASSTWIPDHEDIVRDAQGRPIDGDVGLPSSDLIRGQFGALDRIDRLQGIDVVTGIAALTFYRGGSVAPFVAWIADWNHAPAMEWVASVQFLPKPNVIVEPTLRIFWTGGRNVDDPLGIGRLREWDELELRVTYQF